jgi:hypothetical protein
MRIRGLNGGADSSFLLLFDRLPLTGLGGAEDGFDDGHVFDALF